MTVPGPHALYVHQQMLSNLRAKGTWVQIALVRIVLPASAQILGLVAIAAAFAACQLVVTTIVFLRPVWAAGQLVGGRLGHVLGVALSTFRAKIGAVAARIQMNVVRAGVNYRF